MCLDAIMAAVVTVSNGHVYQDPCLRQAGLRVQPEYIGKTKEIRSVRVINDTPYTMISESTLPTSEDPSVGKDYRHALPSLQDKGDTNVVILYPNGGVKDITFVLTFPGYNKHYETYPVE
jgi:hypothetical protein